MLTVGEALALEVFAGAQVVAGEGGLNKPVAWVHNSSVPDAAQWLNGGELVLTTPFNMPTAPDEQVAYLRAIIERGAVGLCVAVGRMLDQTPLHLREVAAGHGFPLVEIPYQTRFVDVARRVNEQIAQANMALVRRVLTIQQTLTQLVLEGGGFAQLAETMAGLIGQSISIENDRFEALASANIAAVDEARRYTQQYGRTDPRLVAALQAEILPEIRRTLRPVFIPQMAHVGLEMERILAPIVVHGEIYGYMWIIADDRPLSELDHMAIESGSTIAALMLLHQDTVQSAEASLKGSLLTRLIQGERSATDLLTDQALRYGLDLRQPFRSLLLEAPLALYTQTTSKGMHRLYRQVNRLVTGQKLPAIVGQFAGQVMVLTQDGEPVEVLASGIHGEANGQVVRVGISAAQSGADRVALAHSQCREVLHITRRLEQTAHTVYFDDLGYLHTLYHAGPGALAGSPLVPVLRALRAEQGVDLFHTLEVYLDLGGRGVGAAEALHIHRSTLNYRLQRITEITGADLSDPAARVDLQVALKLVRLFGDEAF
jgi:purine catabolism regulator